MQREKSPVWSVESKDSGREREGKQVITSGAALWQIIILKQEEDQPNTANLCNSAGLHLSVTGTLQPDEPLPLDKL